MRSLLALFTIVSAFMLMSCSNVDQDLSPVGPEMQKISATEVSATYPYLTSFVSIPIESYTVLPGAGGIEVEVGDEGWPVNLEHIYVMLEYKNETNTCLDKLVYLEKPRSITFQIDGFETSELKAIKVYCYVPTSDPGIQNPYHPLNFFGNVEILWSTNYADMEDNMIEIKLQDNTKRLGDTFAEISTDEGSYIAFIDIPKSKQIFIPINSSLVTTGVKLFSWSD